MTAYIGTRSLEWAAETETNFLLTIQHQRASEAFRRSLWDKRKAIAAVVRHHLRLRKHNACRVLPPASWIQGGFNACVVVEVDDDDGDGITRYVFRCALPHRLAEQPYPGTTDEKVRCEVAAYAWLQEHCAEIRIPALFGFGFLDGRQFTHVRQAPLYTRLCHAFRKWIRRVLGLPLLSSYTRNASAPAVGAAYLLLEHIGPETGQMLSNTWAKHRNDAQRRERLFRGMARIILSLSRLPQPRIGSFCFNPMDSTLTLTNRPLTCAMVLLENSGTPRAIQPAQVYQTADTFAADMLTLYDNHLLHNPHAVRDDDDARERLAMRALLRAVMHHFVPADRREGPFLLQLTDFHQSNIFVDDAWNVTCLLDLEWICALPADMLSVPYWLTNCSIDAIVDDQYPLFDEARKAFLQILDEESRRRRTQQEHSIDIVHTMNATWASKAVWFWACIRSVNSWVFLVEDHILPKFTQDKMVDLKQAAAFWQAGVDDVVRQKVEDETKLIITERYHGFRAVARLDHWQGSGRAFIIRKRPAGERDGVVRICNVLRNGNAWPAAGPNGRWEGTTGHGPAGEHGADMPPEAGPGPTPSSRGFLQGHASGGGMGSRWGVLRAGRLERRLESGRAAHQAPDSSPNAGQHQNPRVGRGETVSSCN
ncbi:hypothetical protein SPI_05706 [Niveomyces insectorum RCEF 264]|uniref:Aminoglycoside phosphotransferase n=1 Tax=Niveomyces insectorum RCEF 264 TaxID=1081102 RepID=A0A167TGK8_9HYPO|nr:hypothetical protein SPI_05706 [Niveomyces insectorum RCEF 264]